MGTSTWDKRFINDAQLSYSRVKWKTRRPLFVVHRDFGFPLTDVAQVVGHLGNAGTFRSNIPGLLLSWVSALPPEGQLGVPELGVMITNDVLVKHHWEWRFGITPIPSPPYNAGNYTFEARLIIDSKKIAFSHDLAEDGINQHSTDFFHDALDKVHTPSGSIGHPHPELENFLKAVFPRA